MVATRRSTSAAPSTSLIYMRLTDPDRAYAIRWCSYPNINSTLTLNCSTDTRDG